MQAPINVFSTIAKKITSGPQTADIAPDMKDKIQGGGDQQTQHTGVEDPSKPSQQTNPPEPGKPTTGTTGTKPPGEHPVEAPGTSAGGGSENTNHDAKQAAFDHLKDTNVLVKANVKPSSARAVLKALHDGGYLKNPD